ncbi:histone-lysine N-methyltransferase, H3 lysine-79 specific-like [Branchiostoma floridae]|uniref:Histone-lysine N-methyltransferase, H3 lysine-79 specific-like n=1 Tax=Branchiostoma floridae TaxID=7739 RepID=A0A9J7LEH5_BRAFL|nr:histone-lysine N-methyltransferase, H3 lysine-79 specific-like [Branchiostoma floridae]
MYSALIVTLETDCLGTMERSSRSAKSKAPAKVWFHIFVKLPRGLMTSLRVHADMTVGELQGMVEEASGIPCDVQKVTTSQNSGPDKELLLGQLGLRAGSTVSVGPDDRWRDVFGAAMMGDYWLVRRCVDGMEEGETRTDGRFCAMFLAAHRGHLDLLQKLLADGQNVNRKTTGGRSALLIAHARGHSQCVDVLLDHGADTSDLPNGQVQRTANMAPGEDQQQDTEESSTFNRLSTHSSIGARDETAETSNRKSPTTSLDEHESSSNGQKHDDLIAPPNGGTSQSRANRKHHSTPKEEDINPLKKVRSRNEDDEAFDREDNGQPGRVDRLKQFSRTRSAGRRSSAPVVSLVNRPNSALVGRVKTWGGTPQPRIANLRRGSESSEADDRLSPLPGLTPRRHHHPASITADAASILKSMSSTEEVEPIAPPNSPRHAFIGLDPACPPARPRPSLTGRRLTGLRRVSLPAALPSRAKLPTGPSPNQKKTFDEWLEEVEERKKFEEEQKTWNRLQEMHEQALREDAKYKKRLSFDDWSRQKELEKIHKMEEYEEDKEKSQQKERRQKMSAEEYQKWVLRKEQEELEKERQKQKEAEKDYQRWLKLKEELQEVEKKMGRVSLRPKSTQRRMSLQYAARS